MNENEYLLTCLGEEAAEVIQGASKAIRFGVNSANYSALEHLSNKQMIINELNDMMAIVSMLVDKKVLPEGWNSPSFQNKKKSKVQRYMNQSIEVYETLDR